jgi:hypothetical protein
MLVVSNPIGGLLRVATRSMALLVVLLGAAVAQANPWARALGDAYAMQRKTEDISERLNKSFPYSPATHAALQLDNAACQLLESVKCGASWQQVQSTLHRTCSLATQVNALVNSDCDVRNDRHTRNNLTELARRVERLRLNLDKAYAATQPKFCPPSHAHQPDFDRYPHAQSAPPQWRGGISLRVAPGNPTYVNPRQYAQPNGTPYYPRNTYDFDREPFTHEAPAYGFPEGANPYDFGPEFVPPPAPPQPRQYRVESNPASSVQRAAAIAELSIEAIRLLRSR